MVPSAVVADHPDGRVDPFGLGDGHGDGNGGRVELLEIGADRGADVEVHLGGGIRFNACVIDEFGVDAFVGLFGGGIRKVREQNYGVALAAGGLERVVDLCGDAEIGGIPRENLGLAHVLGGDDDLLGQVVEHGSHHILRGVGVHFVEILAGGEESRGGRQHHRISLDFHGS